uniref:Magnesium transporter n=1 Tax=Chenopodium quinoa TaxID=63459 RepID=A0A803NCC8_CHEQI
MGREGYVVPVDPQMSLSVVLKKKPAGSRSWILLDSSSHATVLDLDKHAIMHRVQIHARDLRILDPLLSYPSAILGREKAIVLNLEHIKAIITADEVLLRDPSDENVIPVVQELQRRLCPGSTAPKANGDGKESGGHDVEATEEDESPFEFRALEVALDSICSFLAARTTDLETAAYPALDELTSKISSRNLDRVRKLKSAMTRLTASCSEADQEPIGFPVSPTVISKMSRASRASMVTGRSDENDVEELEMLLEAYFMQIDGTLNKLTTLREYIDDTEDYINIQLDNHRNQLIQVWTPPSSLNA